MNTFALSAAAASTRWADVLAARTALQAAGLTVNAAPSTQPDNWTAATISCVEGDFVLTRTGTHLDVLCAPCTAPNLARVVQAFAVAFGLSAVATTTAPDTTKRQRLTVLQAKGGARSAAETVEMLNLLVDVLT